MVRVSDVKIQQCGPRHTIYLKKDLVSDSAFPFEIGESLRVRIDGSTIVIEKKEENLSSGGGIVALHIQTNQHEADDERNMNPSSHLKRNINKTGRR